MQTVTKMSYKNFMLAAQLVNQTDIVSFLLENERDGEFENCYYNRYDLLLSNAKTIPSTLFYNRLDAGDEFDDIKGRETETIQRTVFEWRLVPVWLANVLIQRGETVLKYMGCSWWGIQSLNETGAACMAVLSDVYRELHTE